MLKHMIRKIVISLFLGLVLSIFLISIDSGFQEVIGSFFCQTFSRSLNCRMEGKVTCVNIWRGSLTLKDVRTLPSEPQDSSWHWTSETFTIGFSWLHLFLRGKIIFLIKTDNLRVYSDLAHTQAAIMPHLEKMIAPPALPIETQLAGFDVDHGHLELNDKEVHRTITADWSSKTGRSGSFIKNTIYLKNGCLRQQEHEYIVGLNGTLTAQLSLNNPQTLWKGGLECKSRLPFLDPQELYYAKASWEDKNGTLEIRTLHNSLKVDPCIITYKSDTHGTERLWISAHAQGNVAPFKSLTPLAALQGSGTLTCSGFIEYPHSLDIHATLTNLAFSPLIPPLDCLISAHKEGSLTTGNCSLLKETTPLLQGIWQWDKKNHTASCSLTNPTHFPVPFAPAWHIAENKLGISATQQNERQYDISYTCTFLNTLKKEEKKGEGTITITDHEIEGTGFFDEITYALTGNTTFPYLKSAECTDTQGNKHLTIQPENNNPHQLLIQVPFTTIRSLLSRWSGYHLQGTGHVECHLLFSPEKVTSLLDLKESTIRIGETYNFINSFHAEGFFDYQLQKLIIRNLVGGLHTGSFSSHRMTFLFNGPQLKFMHAPLIFNRCLVNIKKDLFAILSGNILFSKKPSQSPLVSANVIFDRAQLKENLFSSSWQKTVQDFAYGMVKTQPSHITYDLHLQTKEPIRVDTGFLNTQASLWLHITGSQNTPVVEGMVKLHNGSLHFPYKPLFISKGEVIFRPENFNNPLVELNARNTIKNNVINLHVSGSLHDYHLLFESSPPLTDEQIITLLCVGSPEETLMSMVPTLLIQNVGSLLFGSDQLGVLERYFKPLNSSFNIQFVPRFSDQSARGGLRGGIEINVNDRWRALLQKNFSLTEDTRVELEYLVSDDIAVRAVRDEERDIGAEIEMRWKW